MQDLCDLSLSLYRTSHVDKVLEAASFRSDIGLIMRLGVLPDGDGEMGEWENDPGPVELILHLSRIQAF